MTRAIVKNLDAYHTLTVCLHQHIFIAKHDRFRIGELCVWHKVLFVRGNVPCRITIKVPAVRFHTPYFWSSPTCTRKPSAFVFAADLPSLPLLAAAFEATPQVSDRVVLTCCKEISVLRDQFFFSWSLLEFIFVEFDFLLSFTCAKNTVILADASLPAGSSIAQSFLMSIFMFFCSYECYPKQSWNCRIPYQVWHNIRAANRSSKSVLALCFSNSSFKSTNNFLQLRVMRTSIFFAFPLCLEVRLNEHVKPLRTTTLNPCTQLIQNVFSTGAINRISATDSLSVLAIMLLIPFSAEAVHVQAGQGTFEIHQKCLLGNKRAKALKYAIAI